MTLSRFQTLSTQLDQPARASLPNTVRFGAYNIFLPVCSNQACPAGVMEPGTRTQTRTGLCQGAGGKPDLSRPPSGSPQRILQISWFFALGRRIVRLDMLERLADLVRSEQDKNAEDKSKNKAFQITADMLSLMGCGEEDMVGILSKLGYKSRQVAPELNTEVNTDLDIEATNADIVVDPEQAGETETENTPDLNAAPALETWWYYAEQNQRRQQKTPKENSGKTRNKPGSKASQTTKASKARKDTKKPRTHLLRLWRR